MLIFESSREGWLLQNFLLLGITIIDKGHRFAALGQFPSVS
jgi:hypothetical protein